MRKLVLPLFMVFMLLVLSACGPETPAVQPTSTSAPAPTAMTEESPTAMAAESPTAMTAESPTAMVAESPTAMSPITATAMVPVTPTIDTSFSTIKSRGKLVVGVKYDVRIFGYLNPATNAVEGFDADMGREVAKRIFGSPDAVEFVEAISANRIPYLNEGRVDVVFSTMTANEDRAKQIDFSDTYYVAGQSLLVPVNSSIASVKDLAGKTVGTVKGSTSEKNIRAFAPQATIELFDKYSDAVTAMDAGRVEVVTTDDIILLGFQRDNPDKFKVVGGQFTQEPYAGGVKKGNTELLTEVNAAIRDIKQSGRWAEIYKTWIGTDPGAVPPQEWRDVYKTAPTIPPLPATPTP